MTGRRHTDWTPDGAMCPTCSAYADAPVTDGGQHCHCGTCDGAILPGMAECAWCGTDTGLAAPLPADLPGALALAATAPDCPLGAARVAAILAEPERLALALLDTAYPGLPR